MSTENELTGAERRARIEQIRNGLTDKGWVDDIGSTRRDTIEVISFLLEVIDDLREHAQDVMDAHARRMIERHQEENRLKQALLTVRSCGYLAESEERVIDEVVGEG